MKKKPTSNAVSQGAQSKITDSNSWIVSLQHFTAENSLGSTIINKDEKQIHYVIVSTFDGWVSIKCIDVQGIKWMKQYEMKMTMPVVNSYIEFNEKFQPQSIVLAYFDGSIDYSPWSKIKKNYALELQAGKKRSISQTLPQVIRQSLRPAYLNTIVDESSNIEETFMLQTVCFLHKEGDYIYLINFKGQLKIFRLKDNSTKIQLFGKISLQNRVIKALNLVGYMRGKKGSIVVAICFVDTPFPIILELSPKITQQQIEQKLQFIYQKQMTNFDIPSKDISPIKLVTYDPVINLIITCNQNNKIQIFTSGQQKFYQKDNVFVTDLIKSFSIIYKEKTEVINDISVKDNLLAIICKHSFSTYDLKEDFMLKQGQKLKEQIEIGKLVSPQSLKGKTLLLLKKKFYYQDPSVRKSTTLHLFIGK